MTLDEIRILNDADMQAVNQLIQERLSSDVALVNQLGFYIVNSGGKRIRPMIATLAARALGYQGQDHSKVAAIVEFIHTATLLHDDVVDESELRRGRDTANSLFGNAASVLVGDFLYTRAFQMMTELDDLRILKIMADATNVIAEGEVMQLMNINDASTSESNYMAVIYAKTARLFEAASQIAAIIQKAPEPIERALQDYGRYLGTAFQLIDDVLDYSADSDTMGKNLGDDLAEGKPTLPLIHALRHGNPQQQQLITEAIEQGNGMDNLTAILAALHDTDALGYSRMRAQQEAQKAIDALQVLPESEYKQALVTLAHLAVERSS